MTVSGCSGTIIGYDKDTNRFKIRLTNNLMNPEGLFGIEQLKLVEVIKPAETVPPDLNVPLPLQEHQDMASFAPTHDLFGFDMSSSHGYGLHPPGYYLESSASFEQQFELSSALQAPAPSNYAAPTASFEQHERFSPPPPMANENALDASAYLGFASLDDYGTNTGEHGSVVKELALGENPAGFEDPYIGSEDTAVGLKTTGETEHEVRYYKTSMQSQKYSVVHSISYFSFSLHFIS